MATKNEGTLQARAIGADTLRERVERRAYELYEQRGCMDGFATQDWLQAEREMVLQTERADDEKDEGARPGGNTPELRVTI